MKVLVTGASGFTGSYVVPLLLENDLSVHCFVRPDSDLQYVPVDKVVLHYGDLDDPSSLEHALEGMDALVNIASLGFGHAAGIVSATEKAGIKRSVFISTTAIFTNLNASSKQARTEAESGITDSSLDYTILRPTMIYGSSRDRNICRLIRYLQRYPLIPIIGSGEHLQQPIYVGDVAQAVINALNSSKTIRKAYNISGASPLTFNQVIRTICDRLGRSVYCLHLPVAPIVSLLSLLEKVATPPIKAEQVLRLNEDKAFDHSEARADFGFKPLTFKEGVRIQLEEMRGQ